MKEFKPGELDELLGRLTPEQGRVLKEKTFQLIEQHFHGVEWEVLERAFNEFHSQYDLLKSLAQGPIIEMVRQMAGDIEIKDFAKLLILLGCSALAQKDIHAAVQEIGQQSKPAADKPKRFEVNLSRLPKLN
jgi:hypothetical protein